MKLDFNRRIVATCTGILLAANMFAADTNQPAALTRDEMAGNYLQIQEQIHATQIAIEKAQLATTLLTKSNADALAGRLQSLEQSVAAQRTDDAETARKTQQLMLFTAGAFGLAGLGVMLFMVYFQWRAFTQLAEISAQHHAAMANGNAIHQLAAPGRATVDASNAQLLDVVDQLEKRLHELESGQRFLPEIAVAKPVDSLAEGQGHLDLNAPEKALEFFEKFLAAQPRHAGALVKKAAALEKLGRAEEALTVYNHAIAADSTLAIAHLHKGGLLNQMRRYDEALQCYDEALRSTDKKVKA